MDLRQRIGNLVVESGILSVGVAFHSILTGEQFEINGSVVFHAASMMKVPVMMEAYYRADEGAISLEDRVPIKNVFPSLIESQPFTLDPEDDADKTLYDRVGESETVRHLIELAITRSGNLATNLLIDLLGADRVSSRMGELGAGEMVVIRGVMDGPAFDAGLNNTATANAYLRLMLLIGRNQVVSASVSTEILGVLCRQEHNEAIPAGLPTGAVVAHKTGWNTDIYHDGGIVLVDEEPAFALAVFTKGSKEMQEAQSLIASIAQTCWTDIYGS